MALTDFAIFQTFQRIWETYRQINPEKEASSRKAFEVACKTGVSPKDIENAVLIYYHESLSIDPQYRYQLGNFIREKHYQDYIDSHRDFGTYLADLEQQKADAEALLTTWNEVCRDHWCPIYDLPTKVGLAKRALQDEAFNKNWKKALDIATKIFYKPLHSSDPRSRINLTFRWFTTLGEKHTVMRLIEREYGKPEEPDKLPPRPKEISQEELDKKDREMREAWKEVFGSDLGGVELPKEEPKIDIDDFHLIDEKDGTTGLRD